MTKSALCIAILVLVIISAAGCKKNTGINKIQEGQDQVGGMQLVPSIKVIQQAFSPMQRYCSTTAFMEKETLLQNWKEISMVTSTPVTQSK